jgi:hypothetical protein
MIELIKDPNQLQGTCYFEFLPGIYKDKCWNENSVFIDELEIDYISPILAKHIRKYDHYSFMSADKSVWKNIINDLNQMKESLRTSKSFDEFTSQLSFAFRVTHEFEKDFEESKVKFIKMIDDFVLWIRETLKNHNQMAVLGM